MNRKIIRNKAHICDILAKKGGGKRQDMSLEKNRVDKIAVLELDEIGTILKNNQAKWI